MLTKTIEQTEEKRINISTRVKPSLLRRVDIVAMQCSHRQGKFVGKADVWEVALTEYLERHFPEV